MSIACVVIASEKRWHTTLIPLVESVAPQYPDEFVVVGDFDASSNLPRYLKVAPITRTTIDALIKRDAGWAATTADAVLFLCDDHRVAPDFVQVYRERYESRDDWDFLCPSRFVIRPGYEGRYPLNVGRDMNYVGGHAGIYRRNCAQLLPWTAGPHHRNWDVLHSHELIKRGARLVYADTDLAVEDIEPGATPWL